MGDSGNCLYTSTLKKLQYGRVERVYIDRQSAPAKVFVKFTNQLSALRVCKYHVHD